MKPESPVIPPVVCAVEHPDPDFESPCSINHMTVIPGLCPSCGNDVKIEMKSCPNCNFKLGYKNNQ
ncbi:MAG: hypothetical protein HN534_02070 [Euryarchaeota archaeon]|nr:hypothetical protein [Euryarchaeota archaeon]MBT3653706.1 hypothetical protein [Euryarchaeota archaeon]MBT3757819.1 hypothetical protein [Euryarchaeota archaeon]MBT4051107.1 hypothetical protein [Euryarchaeota archaeon]MBT4346583.1 hypothetical protein [Euryarchaeota archaeon]